MQARGIKMAAEIAETPRVYNSLISNYWDFESVKDILPKREIKSILILARGTSDNAAHFLKYLIQTQIGLPVGLTSPSVVSIYNSKLLYENSLVIAISQSGQSPDLVKYAEAAKNAWTFQAQANLHLAERCLSLSLSGNHSYRLLYQSVVLNYTKYDQSSSIKSLINLSWNVL